jgi:hypothetical protein
MDQGTSGKMKTLMTVAAAAVMVGGFFVFLNVLY